jgi:septum site-determining protein MinC
VTRKPIEIKIATVVAVAVHLNEADVVKLEAALNVMTGGASDFFDDELAILDVEHIAHLQFDWSKVVVLLKSFGLKAVAVRNALEDQHDTIRALGLNIELASKTRPELSANSSEGETEVTQQASASVPEPVIQVAPIVAPQHVPAMVIDTPVRAGQRIYARGCDLIITASVNNGAEVIADGSIHIYAPLRGRALAGARGNTDARIFAMGMEAELVSIAGIYRTFDNGFPQLSPNMPVQIKLIGDSIEVSSVKSN